MKILSIFFLYIIFISLKLQGNEDVNSKILFKLNEKVFTNIDLERRIEYLEF